MSSYLQFQEARDRLRQATQIILDLEAACQKAGEDAADAEGVYRSDLAAAFKRRRDDGDAVQAAEIGARGETAVQKRATLAAAAALKLSHEKIEDARDSRRSLWRLIEWSREHDRTVPAQNGPAQAENVPGTSWP